MSHHPPSLCYLCARALREKSPDAPAFFEVDAAAECEADPCLTSQEVAASQAEARAEWPGRVDDDPACDCGRCDECVERAVAFWESVRDDC